MINYKKIITSCLALSVIVTAFSGCKKNVDETVEAEYPTIKWYNYGPQVRELK